jgi:hypothetical protein
MVYSFIEGQRGHLGHVDVGHVEDSESGEELGKYGSDEVNEQIMVVRCGKYGSKRWW